MDRTEHKTEGVDRGRLTLHSFRQSEPSIPQNQAIRSAATAVADATAAHGGLSARAGSAEFSAFIEAQRQAFLEWATRSGMILDAGQTQAWFANNLLSVQSSEHIVAYENGLAVKMADIVANGTASPYEYLTDAWLANFAFGDQIAIEGVFCDGDRVKIVTSQPWRLGDHPPVLELNEHLVRDYPGSAAGAFELKEPAELAGVTVWDNKPANWIKSADGTMAPIDVRFIFADRLNEDHRREVVTQLMANHPLDY